MKPGKTKDFPRGKLNEHDEGGLRIAIAVQDKTVIVDFGTSTAWIGLDKATALALGQSLIEKANSI
jgi:hypothetical protein